MCLFYLASIDAVFGSKKGLVSDFQPYVSRQRLNQNISHIVYILKSFLPCQLGRVFV